MIYVDHISKSFKNSTVLDDITLSFEDGHIYGIIGYNGSGKTVLFKCICGFLKYDAGKIIVNQKVIGQDIDMITDAGIIIEEPSFLKNKSAYQNLNFLYLLRNKSNKQHIFNVLEQVGLNPLDKKKVGKFSLGMKQRLAIAQAIMDNPSILILDEPMNGLDRNGIQEMRKLFLKLKSEGKTILLASHNKDDIDMLCDAVYEMDSGKLVCIRDVHTGTVLPC